MERVSHFKRNPKSRWCRRLWNISRRDYIFIFTFAEFSVRFCFIYFLSIRVTCGTTFFVLYFGLSTKIAVTNNLSIYACIFEHHRNFRSACWTDRRQDFIFMFRSAVMWFLYYYYVDLSAILLQKSEVLNSSFPRMQTYGMSITRNQEPGHNRNGIWNKR